VETGPITGSKLPVDASNDLDQTTISPALLMKQPKISDLITQENPTAQDATLTRILGEEDWDFDAFLAAYDDEAEAATSRHLHNILYPTTRQSPPTIPSKSPQINAEPKTLRSSKIHAFDPEKTYKQGKEAIFQPWTSSSGFDFKYSENGELEDKTLSAEKLADFLYDHPDQPGKMVLWIQSCPADSSRRYPGWNTARCRFRDCPVQNRTIRAGHLRVVFDEKYNMFRHDSDPFMFAATVHLYCLERFLDLPSICRLPNIEVRPDNRAMPREMDGRNRAGLNFPEEFIAGQFLEACCEGKQSLLYGVTDYPEHKSDGASKEHKSDGASKEHSKTLNFAMQTAINRTRKAQPKRMFQQHLGDLEISERIFHANMQSSIGGLGRKRRAEEDAAPEATEPRALRS
jgi:hypothetical protein